jgi:hypothetical protein
MPATITVKPWSDPLLDIAGARMILDLDSLVSRPYGA